VSEKKKKFYPQIQGVTEREGAGAREGNNADRTGPWDREREREGEE
jgi:hypothetical protein